MNVEKAIEETINQINKKIQKPTVAQTSGAVLHLSQAALNLAHTAIVMSELNSKENKDKKYEEKS